MLRANLIFIYKKKEKTIDGMLFQLKSFLENRNNWRTVDAYSKAPSRMDEGDWVMG